MRKEAGLTALFEKVQQQNLLGKEKLGTLPQKLEWNTGNTAPVT